MKVYKILAALLVIAGVVSVGSATLPIATYELFTSKRFDNKNNGLLSPVGRSAITGNVVDLTHASNWFVNSPINPPPINTNVKYYTVSIPKLKINGATVEIGGEDLAKNLIHYQGTAAPGRVGNTVIFGHSVLPQFFNPKNYLTIFSTLPTLKLGDQILVDYDGIKYEFIISEMFEVEPEDIEVLAQPNDRTHLTLITCVPPGTYLRRLVVKAELADDRL